MVERGPEKAGVGGSIPSLATILSIGLAGLGVYPTPLSRVRIFGISEIAGDLWPKILIREILAAKC